MGCDMNVVAITGNLVEDAELRFTKAGVPVLNYCVAVSDRRMNQGTGHWEDSPIFVDCAQFGNFAERISSRLTKGSKVAVMGRLGQKMWVGKDGVMRQKLSVVTDRIEFQTKS